jgi:prolipoprotein diacylglyceryl transferase
MFLIGFAIGYKIVERMFKHEGAPESWLGTLLMWVFAGTIIGARLGHCFFYEWDYYSQDPIKILYFWEGGLASHGGTIGVILGVFCFSWFTTKRSPLWTFDRLVVAIALVGALIRMGNLFNSEIYGHATTLPWGFMFPLSRQWHLLYEGQACHPTQIYEALCYLVLFVLLMWMYWKRNAQERPGLILGIFFIGIFFSRFLIEFIKNDQVAFEQNMTLNMGQLLSIPFILIGVVLIIRALLRPRQHLEYPNCFPPEPNAKKKK